MLLKHSLKVFVLRELMKVDQRTFTDLMSLTQSTSGNLGKAMERLVSARYVRKVPNMQKVSLYQITFKGKCAYREYINHINK